MAVIIGLALLAAQDEPRGIDRAEFRLAPDVIALDGQEITLSLRVSSGGVPVNRVKLAIESGSWHHVFPDLPLKMLDPVIRVGRDFPVLWDITRADFVERRFRTNIDVTIDGNGFPKVFSGAELLTVHVRLASTEINRFYPVEVWLPTNSFGLFTPDGTRLGTINLNDFATIRTPRQGDVNASGEIDVADVILITRHIVGRIVLSGHQQKLADVDRNSSVAVGDVVLLLRHLVGLSTIPPD